MLGTAYILSVLRPDETCFRKDERSFNFHAQKAKFERKKISLDRSSHYSTRQCHPVLIYCSWYRIRHLTTLEWAERAIDDETIWLCGEQRARIQEIAIHTVLAKNRSSVRIHLANFLTLLYYTQNTIFFSQRKLSPPRNFPFGGPKVSLRHPSPVHFVLEGMENMTILWHCTTGSAVSYRTLHYEVSTSWICLFF